MNDCIVRIKNNVVQHVKDHKEAYIVGTVTAVVAGVAVYVAMKNQAIEETSVTNDSFKIVDFKWKSPTTNNVTVTIEPRGDLGNPVRCIETGELFASQNFAAAVNNISPSNMSKHLNGTLDHVKGLHFERLPWNES